ncbi:MAG: recombinase family protein [Oscillibacter sp.]|nr:recombinase family protein [Oscillibacter sp.]
MEQTAAAQTTQTARKVRIIPAVQKTAGQSRNRDGTKRVAAYCRVSTDSEEQLNSYAAQKAYYTQLIKENPEWELAGIFADAGISGTSMKNRTQFNRMIAACKKGEIDLIYTKSLSRFARNTVDCLEVVRSLKAMGIGVVFEKENINTLTATSEFLITLFSGFAQAESESLSRNVLWGKQKSMEAGNVPFQYKKMLGYEKGPDGNPQIVEAEAETVRRIYRMYLRGASLGTIEQELAADGVPTAEGVTAWSRQVIRNILTNEKYAGDAILQKTYVTDCISKKVRKNNGERTKYYVENHHAGIVSREVYQRVQEEMSRRDSKRKVMQKSAKTEQGKYSGKYALSELLVCGECGSPYKRCTWSKNGTKRIVWRCVSRLEYGKKYCHMSPTMDEDRIQRGIVTALNQYAANPAEIVNNAMKLAGNAIHGGEGDGPSLMELERMLEDVTERQAAALDRVLDDMTNLELNERLRELTEEKQRVMEQVEAARADAVRRSNQSARLRELADWLEKQPKELVAYDEAVTRRMVERITVADEDTLLVRIRDVDAELEVHLPPRKPENPEKKAKGSSKEQ